MINIQEYINTQLQGSSVIDTAIAQVFNRSPIDMKLNEIGWLLEQYSNILDFEYYLDVRSLTYKYRVSYDGDIYHGIIVDEFLRNVPVVDIVKEITRLVMTELVQHDPEYFFENENEQAMLDAAMDYGFV